MYTQIRLKIVEGNDIERNPETYLGLEEGGDKNPLEVPSGAQSGLKLIHPFTLPAGTYKYRKNSLVPHSSS